VSDMERKAEIAGKFLFRSLMKGYMRPNQLLVSNTATIIEQCFKIAIK
jgi:hypothetical protein